MKRNKIILLRVLTIVILSAVGFLAYTVLLKEEVVKREFKGFLEASIDIAEFDEIVEKSERLVDLKIVRELSSSEIDKLKGESERRLENYTYFEAEILSDFYDSIRNGEKIYLVQDSNYEWQIKGDPIYQASERFVMFLVKNRQEDDCWGAYSGANSVFDVRESNGEVYLYKRLGDIPVEGLPMTSSEAMVVTSFEENPVQYTKKITLGSLLSIVEEYNPLL